MILTMQLETYIVQEEVSGVFLSNNWKENE